MELEQEIALGGRHPGGEPNAIGAGGEAETLAGEEGLEPGRSIRGRAGDASGFFEQAGRGLRGDGGGRGKLEPGGEGGRRGAGVLGGKQEIEYGEHRAAVQKRSAGKDRDDREQARGKARPKLRHNRRMKRRDWLGVMAAPFAGLAQEAKVRIEEIEIWQYEGTREGTRGENAQYQAQPLHVYEGLQPPVYREAGAGKKEALKVSALYLRLKATGGLEGLYGPVDREAAIVIDQQMRGFLKGKDALAGDVLWDQMWRLNRHGRSGHFMLAISAVDNALWDLRGRYFQAPVYRLLGGPSRASVEVYGSALGSSLEPERLRARAKELYEQGFRNQKWFLADGPGRGAEGMKRNIEVARILRETLGPEAGMMFDVFNGWDLPYALRWCQEVEALRPRWLEEPFSSEKVEAYERLSRSTTVPIATGEHFYGRWEVQAFLARDAIRVVQADPEWCGGVSELKKICTLSSIYDVPVIPHGHNLHAAAHVVASEPPTTCPWSEYLVLKMNSYYWFDKYELRPAQGRLHLGERAGFGMEIERAKVEKEKKVTWTA